MILHFTLDSLLKYSLLFAESSIHFNVGPIIIVTIVFIVDLLQNLDLVITNCQPKPPEDSLCMSLGCTRSVLKYVY